MGGPIIAACTEEHPMSEQPPDYSEEELASFGTWVELGALNPEQQRFLDHGLSRRWERREQSGSEWVIEVIKDPVSMLRESPELEGITETSKITTTILHHERGLKRRVIVMTATVEQHSGDVSLVVDKETEKKSS
jgi:hypothetical protein